MWGGGGGGRGRLPLSGSYSSMSVLQTQLTHSPKKRENLHSRPRRLGGSTALHVETRAHTTRLKLYCRWQQGRGLSRGPWVAD